MKIISHAIPVLDFTINTYVAVPATVMKTNGQKRNGFCPGVGLGPFAMPLLWTVVAVARAALGRFEQLIEEVVVVVAVDSDDDNGASSVLVNSRAEKLRLDGVDRAVNKSRGNRLEDIWDVCGVPEYQ